MSKVDWSKAPEGAQYYANKAYWKSNVVTCGYLVLVDNVWLDAGSTLAFSHSPFFYDDVQSKANYIVDANKKVWPSESRIDIIGTNGNTADHYMDETLHQTARVHYETQAELAAKSKQAKPQNKYDREIVGKYGSGKCIVDVYRVLVAFGDIPPEIEHAIKKLLAGGKRGHKDEGLDYLEAIQSIEAYLNRLDDSSDQLKTV